jgi:formylglycine-generating enzyme required for sulfatase activity
MSDAFISYRRKPSAALAQLVQEKLENQHSINAYVDTTRTDSTRVQFPNRLMTAIANAPTFICLLGDGTLESEWVRKEIQKAYELKKHCIPVFQEGYHPATSSNAAIDYLLSFDGVHVFDLKNIYIDEAIEDIAALVIRQSKVAWQWLIPLLVLVLIAFVGGGLFLLNADEDNEASQAITTPTASTTQAVSPTSSATLALIATNMTATPASPETLANSATANPNLLSFPGNPVTANRQWIPIQQDFDGVTMVLVPVGCFMMGSRTEIPIHQQCFEEPFWIDKYEVTNAQYGSVGCEQYSSEPEQPRNCVNWLEARDFCAARGLGTRLPTEREWEYAARGPDNLVYPWGNEFIGENAIYDDTSDFQTASVGSRPEGASWVGALDMSGNLWEWTSSLQQAYPYVGDDGRENPSVVADSIDINAYRSIRGGSFTSPVSASITEFLRASDRNSHSPGFSWFDNGFRCARDYD